MILHQLTFWESLFIKIGVMPKSSFCFSCNNHATTPTNKLELAQIWKLGEPTLNGKFKDSLYIYIYKVYIIYIYIYIRYSKEICRERHKEWKE